MQEQGTGGGHQTRALQQGTGAQYSRARVTGGALHDVPGARPDVALVRTSSEALAVCPKSCSENTWKFLADTPNLDTE